MVLNTVVAHIRRTRTIAAEPQLIWAVLADFGSISAWADSVDHSCLLGSTTGDDAPIGLARRIQIGRNTVVERIVEFDPPHSLAYNIEGLPRLMGRLTNRWELRSTKIGFAAVTLTTTVEIGRRPPQKLTERILCRVTAKQSDGLLAGLVNHLEDTSACESRDG